MTPFGYSGVPTVSQIQSYSQCFRFHKAGHYTPAFSFLLVSLFSFFRT
jgi:hypothetical protein